MSHQDLEQRVKKLERATWKLRGFTILLLAALGAGIAFQIGPQEVVQARAINIIDDDGNPRVLMGLGSVDQGIFVFLDENGRNLLSISPSGLILTAEEGNVRTVLSKGSLAVLNESATARAKLTMTHEDGAGLEIYDRNQLRVGISANPGDSGTIAFFNGQGDPILSLP